MNINHANILYVARLGAGPLETCCPDTTHEDIPYMAEVNPSEDETARKM